MPRLKKTRSIHLDKARTRRDAIVSIDPNLDFNNGQTVAAYSDIIRQAEAALSEYNTTLSKLDNLYNQFKALETQLRDASERMLTGVATQFGKNSAEYEMAGGTRKSERKRLRQPSLTPATTG